MLHTVFQLLSRADEIFWGYIAFILIMVFGFFLSFKGNFFQVRALPSICKTFFQFLTNRTDGKRGVHPLKAFFASTGGMIGIGNVVGIVTAVQIGGPGALVWVWIAGIVGAIVKYCEIYLGFKFRDGGPIYFLKKAFKSRLFPLAVAFLLCIYGVDIYQFSVICESITSNWHVPHILVVVTLLLSILYASLGGIQRIGKICSWIMPAFLLLYLFIGIWVIGQEVRVLPTLIATVFKSAFTGHAAVGGFAGASLLLAIQHGISRAAYSSDIGIGYDSIIQSESSTLHPVRQSRLAILGVFIDNTICTISILIVLISGVWKADVPLLGSQLVQVGLSNYFPYMEYFRKIFVVYACASFLFFSYMPQSHALLVMSISGALLLIINLSGIFRLRSEIIFVEELESQRVAILDNL